MDYNTQLATTGAAELVREFVFNDPEGLCLLHVCRPFRSTIGDGPVSQICHSEWHLCPSVEIITASGGHRRWGSDGDLMKNLTATAC